MPVSNLSVSERIHSLKLLFNDFGIQVLENSLLDQTITAEFGRGKRSVLNKLITDLQLESDSAILANCIGYALEQNMQTDPHIQAIGSVMRTRLPSLFHILDIRQQTKNRIQLLNQLLQHFESKIQIQKNSTVATLQADRILRMLQAAREQLQKNITMQAVGDVIYDSGVVFDLRDLKRCGKFLKCITPILISLEYPNFNIEINLNHCVNALRIISSELQNTKLEVAANILDDIQNIGLIILPDVPDNASIDAVLQKLGLSVGTITIHNIKQRALISGLNEHEIIQIFYNNINIAKLQTSEQKLLTATQQNRRYAATCGYVTKIGNELKCKELQRIGIAGLCLISMRQTFYELKTHNSNVVNFSESLGLILSSTGVLCKNPTLTKIGASVLDGVKAYAGIMAIPGGQAVAIPLAICTTLGKLLLGSKQRQNAQSTIDDQTLLQEVLKRVISLHVDMRQQFGTLFEMLQEQHKELLLSLERGFAQLACSLQLSQMQTLQELYHLDYKVDHLQFRISKEFSELYMEYIQDPISEIEFYHKYKQGDVQQLNRNKIKLSMWLIFKAQHSKVNGSGLIASLNQDMEMSKYISMILQKIDSFDAVLGMVNRYVNLEFNQQLPENLPHVPTWVLSANTYLTLLNEHSTKLDDVDKEPEIIADIVAIGGKMLNFAESLHDNLVLWEAITTSITLQCRLANTELTTISDTNPMSQFKNFSQLSALYAQDYQIRPIYAYAATTGQLEYFDPIRLDITYMWQQHIASHIPVEFIMAEYYALGKLYITYTVDNLMNGFTNLRMPYNDALLPDSARDVLFRIDVHFKAVENSRQILLLNTWFSYDLLNVRKRFDEYYALKFKQGLHHKRYLWIAVDGKKNQVAGHGDTETNKLIDYARLASIYNSWWQQAVPINELQIVERLRSNYEFNRQFGELLDQQQCTNLQRCNIDLMKLQLNAQLLCKIKAQREEMICALYKSNNFQCAIAKIDAHSMVLKVYQQLLNVNSDTHTVGSKFNSLICDVRQDNTISYDFDSAFKELFQWSPIVANLDSYRAGIFYQKVQVLVSQFNTFLHCVQNPTLRLFS